METPLPFTILDGYPVHVHPGDRYTDPHLYVRGTYVHPLACTAEGHVVLRDAEAFDGPRRTLTADESALVRTAQTALETETATRTRAKRERQTRAVQQVLMREVEKLAGMDDVQLYD